MTRDEMVKELVKLELIQLAREVAGGIYRQQANCEATYRAAYGTNPASHDPPEWLLEAMKRAYKRGFADGHWRAGGGFYVEGDE